MGKKYIVEIPEDKIADFVGSTHFLMPYMMAGHIGHHDTGLPIEPYTELDLEHVRKESYDKGYMAAYVKSHMETRGSYQQGLNDAWEAARKIASDNAGRNYSIFGQHFTVEILNTHSASKCIEKIRQYEQKQEEIQVGDEVKNTQTGVKFIVTHLWENNRGEQGVSGFNQECSAFSTILSLVVKTGRSFPEIAAALEKMQEDN